MSNAAKRLIDLFFPDDIACFACDRPANIDAHGFCESCANKAEHVHGLIPPKYIDGITAGVYYDEFLHDAMHKFKYSNAVYLKERFAGLIHIPDDWNGDIIVPVPLYKSRQKERGYNQCALIARSIASSRGLPYTERLVKRIRETQTQTHLSKPERAQNVCGAFAASRKARGLSIIIIDDVTTTGSTLSACAAALKSAGAKAVYAACACAARLD